MKPSYSHKSTGLLRTAMVLICVFFLAALTVGCDDKDSSEAKLEDARIAIDNGQYDDALSFLAGMDGYKARDLRADAYAGLAGIDAFEILAEMDDDSEVNGIDLVGKMLGSGEGDILTSQAITSKLDSIADAKLTLLGPDDEYLEELDEDGQAKLAIIAFTDVGLVIADIISFKTGDADVTLTEEAISNLGENFFNADDVSADQLTQLNKDLNYIDLGIDALVEDGGSNDLADEFDAFMAEIDPNSDGIDKTELVNYLNSRQ